jgi:DNA-binding transcriptional LysR family regulator
MLFYRSQVKLTPSGALFLPYAQKILDLMQEGREAISEMERKRHGPLTIGTTSCLSLAILPRLAKYFHDYHPNLQLRLLTSSTKQIIQQLQEGQIELGIAYSYPQLPNHIEKQTLFFDSFSLITASTNPLAHEQSYLTLKQLKVLPMISFAGGTTERSILDDILQKYGIELKIMIELASVEEIKRLVADGFGTALVPSIAISDRDTGLRRIRVTQFEHSIPVNLYYPEKRYLTRTIRKLIQDISGIYPAEAFE